MIFLLFLISNVIFSQGNNVDPELIAKAKKIHDSVITIDTHDDINIKNFTKNKNYTQDLNTQVNIPKMKKGGLDVSWFVVYSHQGELNELGYKKAYDKAIRSFKAIHKLCEVYAPDEIELALTSADVKRIHASSKKVAMIGVENGYPIGTDLKKIEEFYNLGARYMSLAHQGHSQLSDSNTGEKENVWLHNGLSDIGKQAIKEMNRLGMMIDISHPSKQAFLDMIELSKTPLIASHSSARALCNHSRDLDDEQLLLLKKNGGVVQAVAFAGYVNMVKNNAHKGAQNKVLNDVASKNNFQILGWTERQKLNDTELDTYNKKLDQIKKEANSLLIEAAKKSPPVDVADFIDHIDYMVKLIGIDHVGISSDFDGGGGIKGWNDASETFNITLELVKRGYTKNEIAKLWGLNLLRVLDEVQKYAESNKK
ncbi:MAG: dipeptidase [Candidatus Cloacimonetes bacterium]|nr:dipeptidase [Candidatus Cloacimonadota bacterium]